MIKGNVMPVRRFVTRIALLAQDTFVWVILLVTREAILRRALEHVVDMTLFTGHIQMCIGEFEVSEIVIEMCWLPAFRGMARSAVGTQ